MMKVLLLTCLVLIVTPVVTLGETTEFQKQFTKQMVKSLILPYGDENIDYEVLAELLVNIADIDQQLGEKEDERNGYTKRRQKRDAHEEPTEDLVLNQFLNVGRKPSTSIGPTMSGVCDICASVFTTLKPIAFNYRVWPKLIVLAKQICPRITGGLPEHVCDPIIDNFQAYFKFFMPIVFDTPYTLCDNYFKRLGCGNVDDARIFYEMNLPPKPDTIDAKPELVSL